jgi:hypothetical protein
MRRANSFPMSASFAWAELLLGEHLDVGASTSVGPHVNN